MSMNKAKVLAFSVFALAVSAMHAEFYDMKTEIVPVEVEQNALFSWLRTGSLYWLEFGRGKPGGYLFRDDAGHMVVLSGSVDASSKVISAQLRARSEVEGFLRDKLGDLAVSLFAPSHSYRVTSTYLANRQRLPQEAWWNIPDKTLIATSLTVLRKYEDKSELAISDTGWKMVIYVTMKDGSVERWDLGGKMWAFAIDSFKRTTVENIGAVTPMPEA